MDDQDLCLHRLIAAQAERTPDAVALIAPDRFPLTYRRLGEQIDAVVGALNEAGIGRNGRVALVLPNGPEMALAFLGVACGATCAPLNPDYRASEFDFFLSDLNARALILPAGLDSPARAAAAPRRLPVLDLAPIPDGSAGLFTLTGLPTAPPASDGFAGPDDAALVLHTSGTTSRPKMVPLTHRNLSASAHHIATTLELTSDDRCLNVMPLFHIHGLIGALLASLAAGGSVVCTPGFYAPRFFGWMEEFRPTWYTAVPTMHMTVLARAASHPETIPSTRFAGTPPLRLIRSSSAALAPQVMAELERVFQAPVIESYGMTEAAHQMASNPLPPRRRKPGSVGVAAGPEVAVMDEAGSRLPPGATGEVVIRGANVMRGYESNPEANAEAFQDGWLRTGDQGYLDGDGYLFLTGRLKEMINRGGEKIAPREIDEVLLDHPAIGQAVTFAVPNEKLGEEIAAAVVLRENAVTTECQIREFAAARLADFKVPQRVLIVDEIPKGPTGKLQRIGLAEKLGLAGGERDRVQGSGDGPVQAGTRAAGDGFRVQGSELGGPAVVGTLNSSPAARVPALNSEPPLTLTLSPLEEVLAALWREVLGRETVGVHDGFFELGGDSMLAHQLIARVQDVMSVELSILSLFEEASTVAGMAATLLRNTDEPTRVEKTARLLLELACLTPEQVQAALAAKSTELTA